VGFGPAGVHMKNNPFDGLRKQLGLPEPPADSVNPPEAQDRAARTPPAPRQSGAPGLRDFKPGDFDRSGPARAVVRYERAGRGGKEATVIDQLGLSPGELDVWLKALKASLGCGGSVEGASIMLQGDHRKRLTQVLTARGVRKVIVG